MAGASQGNSILIFLFVFSTLGSDIIERSEEGTEGVGILKQRCEIVT